MTVPSSISSSERSIPGGNWPLVWTSILLVFIFIVCSLEIALRYKGWTPSFLDTEDLWIAQRTSASSAGDDAFILVGASRIQLGIDPDVVDEVTGKQAMQLAINGNSFFPVLENLANDPGITGTILVSAYPQGIKPYTSPDMARDWVDDFNAIAAVDFKQEPYRLIHDRIRMFLGNSMVTRLYDAKPYTVIRRSLFTDDTSGNYLSIDSRRSIDADYTKVTMPDFYYERVRRNYGDDLLQGQLGFENFLTIYGDAISNLEPAPNEMFLQAARELAGYIDKIEARGGSVILVRFPTDKLVLEMDRRLYPRPDFWDRLQNHHDKLIHFEDYPELTAFEMPDGSHLDVRDKADFTRALLAIIIRNGWLN